MLYGKTNNQNLITNKYIIQITLEIINKIN